MNCALPLCSADSDDGSEVVIVIDVLRNTYAQVARSESNSLVCPSFATVQLGGSCF